MEQLATIILLLSLLLNAVALYLMNRTLHGMVEDIMFLKIWMRRIYFQSSSFYLKSLIEARTMAVENEQYELVKRFDKLIKEAQKDMEELLR